MIDQHGCSTKVRFSPAALTALPVGFYATSLFYPSPTLAESAGGRQSKRSPMVLRASWTGYLRLSLITIPVRVFNAISSADKISLNQLHKDCNSRLRQKMICPIHGEVEREQIVKGYEYE